MHSALVNRACVPIFEAAAPWWVCTMFSIEHAHVQFTKTVDMYACAKETVAAVLTLADQQQHMLHSAQGKHACAPVLQQVAFKCIRMHSSNSTCFAAHRCGANKHAMPSAIVCLHEAGYMCTSGSCSPLACCGTTQCDWAALQFLHLCVLPCRPPAQTPTSHKLAPSLGCALPAHSTTPPMQTLDQPATPCAAQ